MSVSNLSDNFLILHVIYDDIKQNDKKKVPSAVSVSNKSDWKMENVLSSRNIYTNVMWSYQHEDLISTELQGWGKI